MLSFKDLKELREESMLIQYYSQELQSFRFFIPEKLKLFLGRKQSRVVNEEKLSFIGKKQ